MAERLSRSLLSPRTPMSNTSTQSKTFLSRKLIAFFISDPSRKPQKPKSTEEDVQDAKLIYYHPSYKVIEEKRRQVGMIEGLATFTESFAGPSNPLESIHTKQHILVVKQWEPNIWITLVSRNPQSITMKGNSVSEVLWHEGDTQETFLMAILKNLCAFFVLLHGSIRHYILENRIDALTDLLEDFIPAFFETVDTDKISLYNELNGFYYGPISQKTFLSIQSFVHRLKDAFSTIRYVSLLFDGYLIYNGMNPHDMLVLYSYLVCYNGSVDSLKLNTFPFGRAPTAASEPGGGASTFGRANFLKESDGYLFGSSRSSLFVPTLYFSDATSGKLVVLLFRRIVLIVIFEDTETVTDELLFSMKEFAVRLQGGLRDLVIPITEQMESTLSREESYRFVYFNNVNKAIRISNSYANSASKDKSIISFNELQHLGKLHAVLNAGITSGNERETIHKVAMKNANSGWIYAVSSFDREFFLLLDNAKASFSEANEEAGNFAKFHFSNICI